MPAFIRRFLMNRGWTRYDLYERVAPAGAGSGEQWVRERLPSELKAYRSKCNHLRNGLIAVVDADTSDVADRIGELDRACDGQSVPRRGREERVLFVVPKRNIETWLAYLRGETVDEDTIYGKYEFESLCHPDADSLDRMCKSGQLERNPPASLERSLRGIPRVSGA